MRRITIAILCTMTLAISMEREPPIVRFFRHFIRHFVSTTESDTIKPPSGTPCTTTTGC